jgi:hypothetical protein
MNSLEFISKQFRIYGDFLSAQPYGSGHINDTYLVLFDQDGICTRYIIQRINHNIFKNPPALMENIERVTKHIRTKLEVAHVENPSRHVLTIIPTKNNRCYYKDPGGDYWRAYFFIEKAQTYDTVQSNDQAFQAARMYGKFQEMLIDLPGPPLHETIADFHNAPVRFRQFQESLKADPLNRAAITKPEIDFLIENAWIFDRLPILVEKGKIPVRTTHNDTKINNVMLDEKTGKGVCIIDLDTVMPGLSLYDFGDLARTTLSPAAEDEPDLDNVYIDISRFKAILNGYLAAAGGFLNETERDNLVTGAKMMTLLIGMRFLIDFLDGDRYYKIHREAHNLDRCRVQFKLVQSMTKHEEEMMAIVENSR